MLGKCLGAAFCADASSSSASASARASDMSNQRQSLVAGEYGQRRQVLHPQPEKLESHKPQRLPSPLTAFTQQHPSQSPLTAFTQQQASQSPLTAFKKQHSASLAVVTQLQQDEEVPEWPQQQQQQPSNYDHKALFAVEPSAVKIGREIGKGAFSVVYSGEYRGQHVAVKCQPKDAEGQIPAFVLREVQVLRQLRHPRLLQFAGAADHVRAKQVWILSEYLNNGDVDLLLKAIRSGTRPHVGWHRLVRIALDAAQGLRFLQDRHVVHRDIKSSNILLDDEHRAKLCDFGFALELEPSTTPTAHGQAEAEESKERRKSYCGTDAYMAPEMFLDEDYDESVDIFSLGIVLMEMLCCRVANADGFLLRLPQYKFRVLLSEFRDALPASCPPQLATLAEQCVAFEPNERPKIDAVVRTLEDVLAHTSTVKDAAATVELVPFTPEEREPQIEEDDEYYGEKDEEDEEEESEYDEDEDEEDTRDHTIDMESDEDDHNVNSQVVDDPFSDEDALQPATAAPHHEGLILKRNRRGNRSWVDKWFTVDHDQLHYTDVPPRWQQQQQQDPAWRCALPPTSSLALRDCRIWKTMEMPELRFNVIDGNWKIKRELQAHSKRELATWMELINQGIDYANELAAREDDHHNNSGSASTSGSRSGSGSGSGSGSNSDFSHAKQTSVPVQTAPQAQTKPLERRASVERGTRKTRRRSSAAGFEEPPELPETAEDREDEVYQWLKQIGFQRYTPSLKAKGFSSLDFIRETGIEAEDLNFLGIKEPKARKAIRSAARTLRGDEDED